jgi:mRNA interferase MazF
MTIPVNLLGWSPGFLTAHQEVQLARALVLAYDLDIALLDN